MTDRGSHHQRRPPDVEEALSSMLWTPYERTPTESSSEDDDERLNKQLCKSHSSYDYRHASPDTFSPISPQYIGNDDPLLTTSASTAAGGAMLQPTPFVPFSNFFYNNDTTRDNNIARTQNYHKNNDSPANHFRFSYPYCGPMPNLNKWWSTALSANEPPPYEALYAKANAYNNPSMEPPAFDAFRTARSAVSSDVKLQLHNGDKSGRACADGVCSKGRVEHSFADDFIAEVGSTSSSTSCTNSPKLTAQHVAANVDSPLHFTQSNCNNNDIIATRVHQPSDDVRQRCSPDCAAAERRSQNVQQTNEGSQQRKEANNNYLGNGASPQANTKADVAADGNYEYMNKARDGETRSSKAAAETTTSRVNQPVSSFNPCSTSPVNTHSNVNTESTAMTTATNRLDRHINTTTTLTPAMNTIANLLTLVRDKAAKTTVVRDSNSNGNGNGNSHKATAEHNANVVVVHSSKCGEPTIIQSTTSSISSRTIESAALEVAVLPLDAPSPSSSSRSPSQLNLWRKARLKQSRTHFESSLVASVAIAPVSAHCKSLVDPNANSISALTPNKCLAELERLYAEFRASESALAVARGSNCGCVSSDADDFVSNMRVNIPATASDSNAAILSSRQENQVLTTSSVFLTSTNSVTTNCSTSGVSGNSGNSLDNLNNNIDRSVSNDGGKHAAISDKGDSNSNSVAILATDSHQCQPSLTIKVNEDDNNNREASASFPTLQSRFNVVLHQPVGSNNGVSVVNCNYSGNEVSDDNDSRTNKYVVGNVGGSNSHAPLATPSASSKASVNSSSSCPVPKVSCSVSGDDVAKNILNNNNESYAAAVVVDSSIHIISVSDRPKSACVIPSPASSCPADSQSTKRARTFTSTECQTDEIASVHLRADRVTSPTATNREQRRRERRERRHQQLHNQSSSNNLQLQFSHRRPIVERHSMPAPPPVTLLHPQHMRHPAAQTASMPAALSAMLRPMLPDLLHSHFPPPYSALPLSGGGGGCTSGATLPPLPPLGCPPPLPPPPGTTLVASVISTVPMPGAPVASDGRFTLPLPIIRRSPSERSGKGCCGQWFAGPPLRALIAVVALGGVACTLGGAALGATGLAGPPSSHLTAALLMIGVGVVLVTVSGAAWRMTAPGGPPCLGLGSNADLRRCGRRPCGRGSGTPHGLLYPEFQHRPPPPSYQASMQEYRLRLLLLDRDRQNGVIRGNSPPPTYRSHLGSLLRAPLTTTIRGAGSSSIAGTSDYSLPPSYRSRNTRSTTVCSERSIETAPSGRLLANEDIPEPASIEQLPDYSSLQSRPSNASRPALISAKTSAPNQNSDTQLRTAAIVEGEASPNMGFRGNASESNLHSAKEKLHPRAFDSHGTSGDGSNHELVTIVTITKAHGQEDGEPCSTNSEEPIEAPAHL